MKTKLNIDFSKPYINQLKELIENYPRSYFTILNKHKIEEILKLRDWINEQTPLLSEKQYRWSTKCYWILHGLTDFPKCDVCGKSITIDVRSISKGYYKTCSPKCNGSNPKRLEKVKKTNFERHGDPNYTNVEKRIATKKRLYETDPEYGENIKRKTKQTKLARYGNENWNNHEKAAKTCIERYGVDNSQKVPEIREKVKKTTLERYGAENVTQTEYWHEKTKKMNLEKYGCEWFLQKENVEARERIKRTNLEKYGHEQIGSVPEVREKIKNTNIERYGCTCSLRNEAVHQKTLSTWMDNYGTDNPFSSTEVQEKVKATNVERYGAENIFATEFGKQKIKETFNERYGCSHPSQNPDIQNKARRRYVYDGLNFDTTPEIAYYIWLKDSNVNFEFHGERYFEYEFMGKTHRYFPDFYIIDENKFIEIKGDHFFTESGKMTCPFRGKAWTDEQYETVCAQYEAKHRCMVENSVIILREADYEKYLDYVSEKYGKNYIEQFRKTGKANGK